MIFKSVKHRLHFRLCLFLNGFNTATYNLKLELNIPNSGGVSDKNFSPYSNAATHLVSALVEGG
jgi:hypothetical protein